MKKYFILLLFSAIYSQSPFQSSLPADITRFGVEQIDSLIYFIGGINNNYQETDTAFIYNLNSNEYSSLPSMNEKRYDAAFLFNSSNQIYAVGGRGDSWDSEYTVEEFDIGNNQWTLILDGENGNNIGGGYDGNNYRYFTTCNGIMYSVSTNRTSWILSLYESSNGLIWNKIDSPWTPSQEPTLISDDSYVYIIGGDYGDSPNTFISFEPNTETFSILEPHSLIGRDFLVIYRDGKIYKFGGNDGSSENNLEIYDINSNSWNQYYFPSHNGGYSDLHSIIIDDNASLYYLFYSDNDLNNSNNGFYFHADNNPHITQMNDMEMYENDTLEIMLSAFTLGSDPYFFDALSSDEDVQVTLNFDTLLIIPNPNWTGDSEIDGIVYTANGYSDTTKFILSVLQTNPRILTIEDVPEDQGGRVYINFSKSYFDSVSGYNNTAYGSYQVERLDDIGWVGVGNYDAYGIEDYIIEVNTLSDSMYTSDGMTTFRVIANMNQGNFISMPDSGYSVDNIAPGVPTGFMIAMGNNGLGLIWNSVQDEDFQYYVIDKSADSLFQTDQYSSFHTTELSFIDTEYEDGNIVYYRIAAVDYAGNRGEYSNTISTDILSVDNGVFPKTYALRQNYPNPFNPITSLRYDLPVDGLVNITIYDMMGRIVKTLVNSSQTAGYKSVQWNATNNRNEPVSAGLYLYTIQAGEFRQTRKMVLLK